MKLRELDKRLEKLEGELGEERIDPREVTAEEWLALAYIRHDLRKERDEELTDDDWAQVKRFMASPAARDELAKLEQQAGAR